MVSLDTCNVSCNSLADLSSRIYVSNKAEDVNVSIFNIITKINESKTLTKYVLFDCKRKFDGRTCNSNHE